MKRNENEVQGNINSRLQFLKVPNPAPSTVPTATPRRHQKCPHLVPHSTTVIPLPQLQVSYTTRPPLPLNESDYHVVVEFLKIRKMELQRVQRERSVGTRANNQ